LSRPPLVTGATGFAGSHLIDELLTSEPAVAAWAHRGSARDPAPRDGRIAWASVDLLDRDEVRRALAETRPSVIYHCAGIAHVGESWSAPERALRVNALGTHHVLEGVRSAGLACAVLVTGSALVYRPSAMPVCEDDPIGPVDPYGVSKLAQEMLALRARQTPVFVAGRSITPGRDRRRVIRPPASRGKSPPSKPDDPLPCSAPAIWNRGET
jgi:GDP-4-dehydro-6-deoxy-D-mannose reductase